MPRKGAFKRCVESVSARGGVSDPRAVCAASIAGKRGRTRGRVNSMFGDLDSKVRQRKYKQQPAYQAGRKIGLQDRRAGRDPKGDRWLYDEAERRWPGGGVLLQNVFRDGYNSEYFKKNAGRKELQELATTAVKAKIAPWSLVGNPKKVKGSTYVVWSGDSSRFFSNIDQALKYINGLKRSGSFDGQKIEKIESNPHKRTRKNHHNEAAAVDAYRDFHGREPEEIIEFETRSSLSGAHRGDWRVDLDQDQDSCGPGVRWPGSHGQELRRRDADAASIEDSACTWRAGISR